MLEKEGRGVDQSSVLLLLLWALAKRRSQGWNCIRSNLFTDSGRCVAVLIK